MLQKVLVKELVVPILIVLFSIIIYFIITNIVKRFLGVKNQKINIRKQRMLVTGINTIIKVFISIIAFVMILEVFSIDTKSLVTSLGAVSVVVGLAFQDLLKDFISGFTILFEDQFSVGDVVTVDGFTGTVIEAGLKSTRIKAYTGEIKIISNRNIVTVINHNLDTNVQILDIAVSYDSDVKLVKDTLEQLCHDFSEEMSLPNEATCLGVESLNDNSIVFRIAIPGAYGDKFGFARAYRARVKDVFNKKGIKISYPRVVINNE